MADRLTKEKEPPDTRIYMGEREDKVANEVVEEKPLREKEKTAVIRKNKYADSNNKSVTYTS
jgi:hypothetical protein